VRFCTLKRHTVNFYLFAIEFRAESFPAFTRGPRKLVYDREQGALIAGTRGFRKPVWPFRAQVCRQELGCPVSFTFVLQSGQIIILVTLYAQAKKADLNKPEENEPRKISGEIRSSLGTGKS
jgi:hypothetical protein